jgi:hypothetical protein
MTKSKLKRVCSAVLAVTAALTIVPLLNPTTASAAGVLQGVADVRAPGGGAALSAGNGDTVFTLRPPSGASCGGDSANDGYLVQSYMVPASVDPSTLTFDSSGPIPNAVGASFRQPLYNSATSGAYVNALTLDNAGSPRPRPGEVINIPDFYFDVFGPGDIPPGAYNLGIACTLGAPSGTQMKEFWNTTMTFTTNPAGGFSQVSWSLGAAPVAPVLSAVTPGDSTLTAAFTHAASTPQSSYTATATPQAADPDCSGGPVTSPSQTTTDPIVIGSLVNLCTYDVVVAAGNGVGSPAVSNVLSGTPVAAALPPVAGLSATPGAPGAGTVNLDWSAPPAGPAPTGYTVTVDPAVGTVTVDVPDTSATVTGLAESTPYVFTVTATYGSPADVGTPASVTASVLPSAVLMQHLTVTVPLGQLVITQVCGTNGPIPADTLGTPGFPSGDLPAVPEDLSGTGPLVAWPGGAPDPRFLDYPNPYPATYPTHCGVDLGTAGLIESGDGAGQFYAADGVLNQVTVLDTRDTDVGWTVTGTMGTFSAGTGLDFSGDQLGWTPFSADTAPYAFPGGTYDQAVSPGPAVNPNTTGGLGDGATFASAPGGAGRGIARLDARLKLLIPVAASSGNYTGTLTITAS